MRSIFYFGTFLLVFSGINFSCSRENLSNTTEPTVWENVFEKVEREKNYLPFMFPNIKVNADKNQCLLCNALIGAILLERSFDMTDVQLVAQLEYFCSTFLKIQDREVCHGVLEINKDHVLYMLNNDKKIGSEEVCTLLLNCEDKNKAFDWTITIPEGTTVDKVTSTGTNTFKIAHITDIHYDPNYTEGKVLKCGEPLCCQDDSQEAKGDETPCGYWSSAENADTSFRLLEDTLDAMVKLAPDYVYFTGDLVAHRVWKTSQEYNAQSVSNVLDLFKKKFKDIPVIPVLGNHEAHPVNMYTPLNISDTSLSQSWLFDKVSEKWTAWLPADTKETIEKGGYYTYLVKDKLRVIVINNNVCHPDNFWNLYLNKDPYGQLEWLVNVLSQAEKDKEIVHILSHVPTSSCLTSWGKAYNSIINRFSNTIAAQFNGHTHRDQFQIYYDSKKQPNNVLFNGASVMPDKANPCFKIYYVDSEGYDVMDMEVYTFDLEQANKDKIIDWKKLYSFKEAFGVNNGLIPSELDSLVGKMADGVKKNDNSLVKKYNNYYFRNSPSGQVCDNTDDCPHKRICEIVTTVKDDTWKCNELLNK